jgi:hypothetical protein
MILGTVQHGSLPDTLVADYKDFELEVVVLGLHYKLYS